MENIAEILLGRLSIDNPDDKKNDLVDLINKVINPPRPVTPDNVHIRAMYLLNDLVNSHGGRFDREGLAKIRDLIIDTPVLIGHNRSEAPLARTFHAELEEKAGVLWLKSFFYWPISSPDTGDTILHKIDSGILKECSISFIYTKPECSFCGEDIRVCRHNNDSGKGDEKAHFIYRGVTEVLETSLVYKGAVKGTFITDRLNRVSDRQISLKYDGQLRSFGLIDSNSDKCKIHIHPLCNYRGNLPELIYRDPSVLTSFGLKNGSIYLFAKNNGFSESGIVEGNIQ